MLKRRRLVPQEYLDFKAYIEIQKGEFESEDWRIISEWLSLKSVLWFKGKTIQQIDEWLDENVAADLKELQIEKANAEVAQAISGMPSETELEDAYQWVDSTGFTGSQKQVSWAKSIAHKHHGAIVRAWKQGKAIPTDSRWWIDNRSNIVVNLPL